MFGNIRDNLMGLLIVFGNLFGNLVLVPYLWIKHILSKEVVTI